MVKLRTLRFTLLIAALAIVVSMALSEVTFAKHDRGRGRFTGRKTGKFINRHDGHDGRFDGRGRFNDKRAEKFINGHDARDGRFDGRGPGHRFDDRRGHGRIPRWRR
ncbi:MAG TPA: hypothetical protein VE715_00260 [Blastocatellia bacterium]|nr:hypothetical protein [Blastocatellia bacterium]